MSLCVHINKDERSDSAKVKFNAHINFLLGMLWRKHTCWPAFTADLSFRAQRTHSAGFHYVVERRVVGLTFAASYGKFIDLKDIETCTWQHARKFPTTVVCEIFI